MPPSPQGRTNDHTLSNQIIEWIGCNKMTNWGHSFALNAVYIDYDVHWHTMDCWLSCDSTIQLPPYPFNNGYYIVSNSSKMMQISDFFHCFLSVLGRFNPKLLHPWILYPLPSDSTASWFHPTSWIWCIVDLPNQPCQPLWCGYWLYH